MPRDDGTEREAARRIIEPGTGDGVREQEKKRQGVKTSGSWILESSGSAFEKYPRASGDLRNRPRRFEFGLIE